LKDHILILVIACTVALILFSAMGFVLFSNKKTTPVPFNGDSQSSTSETSNTSVGQPGNTSDSSATANGTSNGSTSGGSNTGTNGNSSGSSGTPGQI